MLDFFKDSASTEHHMQGKGATAAHNPAESECSAPALSTLVFSLANTFLAVEGPEPLRSSTIPSAEAIDVAIEDIIAHIFDTSESDTTVHVRFCRQFR